jgi:enoyl-CoA hydratase/carnithine racemase
MQEVELHGHHVGYRMAGSGPPLVLLHGITSTSDAWRDVFPRLAERYTVVAPDLIGHGRSAKPRGDYSLGAYAAGMRDLLAVLGFERGTVVGHSFGGGIAMQFSYLFPEFVERMALVSSGGLGREVHPLLRAAVLPGSEWVMPLIAREWSVRAGGAIAAVAGRLGLEAGNDLAEFAAHAAGREPKELQVERLLRALASTTTPIVAAVQGKAVGVGTTMLLHCDYVLLGDDAQLTTPFLNLALVPEAASSHLLPLRIGHVRAFEMFSFGEPVDAQTAVAWGLANKTVPVADLRAEAARVAAKIAAKPLGSLTATKRLMRESERLLSQIASETAVFSKRLKSAEAAEAFTAFAQKRQPDFSNVG